LVVVTYKNRYVKIILIASVVVLALVGCVASGNKLIENATQISIQSRIVKGITTKEKVIKYYVIFCNLLT